VSFHHNKRVILIGVTLEGSWHNYAGCVLCFQLLFETGVLFRVDSHLVENLLLFSWNVSLLLRFFTLFLIYESLLLLFFGYLNCLRLLCFFLLGTLRRRLHERFLFYKRLVSSNLLFLDRLDFGFEFKRFRFLDINLS
jgi:hypothetical protein